MNDNPTPPIPQLAGESAKAYAARVAYLTMGPTRSLEKVRVQTEGKARVTNRIATLEAWSVRFHWQEHARAYDQQLAVRVAQDAAEQYRKDLEDHRVRYQKMGKDLYTIAQGLVSVLARALRGEVIEGKDGKVYTIPAMEMTPAALGVAARAITIAADLEAHALNLAELLPLLDKGGSEDA